jgi:flagellar basal body-associated protein FliL
MVDFGEIINSSANWTVTVLFKPFNFKKWLVLAFIALMAGYMSGGCNLNFNDGGRHEDTSKEVQTDQPSKSAEAGEEKPLTREEMRTVVIVLSVIVLIVVAFIALFTWLGSRFSFVFLEDVIKNDASIAAPFKANGQIGNSYFLFNLVFMGIFLALFGSIVYFCILTLIKTGVINVAEPDIKYFIELFFVLLPYLILALLLFFIFGLISLITTNFVVPVMFKDRIKILQAWSKVLSLLRKNVANFILYLLIKAGFYICAGIVYLLVSLICALVIVIAGALAGIPLYFISTAIPPPSVIIYWVAVGIAATPVLLFLLYCLICLYLPFAVFFRTFSIRFLGRLDPQYDLLVS